MHRTSESMLPQNRRLALPQTRKRWMCGIISCAHRAEERVVPTEPQNREFLPGILHLLLSQQLILAHGLDSEDRSLPRVAPDRLSMHDLYSYATRQDTRRNIEGQHTFRLPPSWSALSLPRNTVP